MGGHVFFHFVDDNGDFVSRKYTPISQVNERGTVTFLQNLGSFQPHRASIKVYKKSDDYPVGGILSQKIAEM